MMRMSEEDKEDHVIEKNTKQASVLMTTTVTTSGESYSLRSNVYLS